MNKRFSPRPQGRFPPTIVCDFIPIIGEHVIRLRPGSAFTILTPSVPPLDSEFRTRVRGLAGCHVAVIAAHDGTAAVGPESVDSHVMHWLIRTSDVLIVWGCGIYVESKQRLEELLGPACRAVVIMTNNDHQWAWVRSTDAHAGRRQAFHGLLFDPNAEPGTLPRMPALLRHGPVQ